SSASSAVGVTGGGSLSFSVRTAEGYSAVPVINGIAYLTAQGDGSYVIENIHSNLNVTVTVSPYSISDPDGNGSGNSSGNGEGSGDGNNSAGDSADSGIPLWIPVILAGAFLACIAAAAAGNIIIKRRKDDGENSS
ncbi:MAG: hypothetical protein LBJ20_06685, partial [Candidatus Methanoplasma sp.]|nr:hypothetical protein [Candidatus Methanoplasma sp.]